MSRYYLDIICLVNDTTTYIALSYTNIKLDDNTLKYKNSKLYTLRRRKEIDINILKELVWIESINICKSQGFISIHANSLICLITFLSYINDIVKKDNIIVYSDRNTGYEFKYRAMTPHEKLLYEQ